MRNALWSGFLTATVCAVTVGLAAQTPPQTPPSSSASQASKSITLSGCIEKAPAEAGASAATAPPAFILADAAPAGSASGTVGTSGGAKPASKYRLDADAAKLTPHVGHKVEITGTVDEMSSSATPPSGATASSAAGPKLKVDSVKMVAATCS
jgi:hypothetical protein